MAKGSFYQYFENKQDVFMYLVSYALGKKMGYIEHVKRDDFENFWDYWRAIYKEGLEFDRECPAQSNFGYHLMDNINSPSMKEMSNSFYQQGVEGMKSMIEPEVKSGAFRKDLSLEKLAFFLMKTGEHLLDYMKLYHNEEMEQRILNGESLFAGKNEKLFFELVENNILLQRSAMDAKK